MGILVYLGLHNRARIYFFILSTDMIEPLL